MHAPAIPETYEQWRHCIVVECGIALTVDFAARRMAVLEDEGAEETRRFRKAYGDAHWQAVRGWFSRAAGEAGAGR